MSEASPRMAHAMALVRWALVCVVTGLAGASIYRAWGPDPERGGPVASHRYYCPMHPQITAAGPGECPICHMALELVPEQGAARPAQTSAPCTDAHGDAGDAHDAHAPEGIVPVMLTLDRQQLGGVVSEPVRRADVRGELRVPAVVEAPESGRAEVRVRAAGFVEEVLVRSSGARVTQGQVLARVFSPQVFQAQQELLVATRWSATGGARQAEVAAAARQSLELLGMTPADIAAMLAAGAPMRTVPVRAPAAGHVLRAGAVLGQYATPEAALYELADLGTVWAVASVWEADLTRVRPGALARFVTPGASAPASARVLLVEPAVSSETRAGRVRLAVPNASLRLRPGMYGEVTFPAVEGATSALTVPRDAVIDTGRARYVFVQRGAEAFEPRVVQTGALAGERWEITAGLADGDRVVTRGAFLVDSESRLRAALSSAGAPR